MDPIVQWRQELKVGHFPFFDWLDLFFVFRVYIIHRFWNNAAGKVYSDELAFEQVGFSARKIRIGKNLFVQISWKGVLDFSCNSDLLRSDCGQLAPVGFKKVCSDPKSDFVDTCAFRLNIWCEIRLFACLCWGLCNEVVFIWAGDFAPELEFLDLFGDWKSFEWLEEEIRLLFTKANTDLFKDFALFEKIGDKATGTNFDGLFFSSSTGLIHEPGLAFNVCLDLFKLLVPVFMLAWREIVDILAVVFEEMITVAVIRKD